MDTLVWKNVIIPNRFAWLGCKEKTLTKIFSKAIITFVALG